MRYVTERSALVLSVGELCAEATAPLHLDLRRGSASLDRLKKGREAHKLLQKRVDSGYEAEVTLTNTTLYQGVCYEVNGRADGVMRSGNTVLVEEIKSVGAGGFERGPDAYHEAQAMCYAHFLCVKDGLDSICVQLTLCRLEDGKTKSFRRTVTAEEAKDFYFHLLSAIAYRAKYLIELELERRPSAEAGRFPYRSVRESQDIMLKECYRGIKSGKKLFIQAPTGTGKTVSSLYPAVRAFGKSYCDKIFYLTAKASTRREAYGAAAKIFESGARLRTVVLSAREQLCPNAAAKEDPAGISRHCNPESCPRAVHFHSKCREALVWLLERQNGYPRATVESVAEQFGICPYEFQLALSELCDIVICDYNYVFDPMVYLRRYFSEEAADANRYVFLIDEAHNLGDRACDMYSAVLKLSEAEAIYGLFCSLEDESLLERMRPLEHLIVTLRGYKRLCRDNLFRDESGVEHGYYLNQSQMLDLNELILSCRSCLEKWMRGHAGQLGETEVLRFTATLKKFLTVAELYGQGFLTFIEVNGEEITVEEICRDPSEILRPILARAHASVLFSATLTPTDYFADILGGGKGAVRVSLPSPFDPSNLCVVAATGVDTRYEARDKSVKRIAAHIAATVSGKAGNYIFFFPSYDYMEQVLEVFTQKYPKVETVVQAREMSLRERERFLDAFAEDRRLRVGFCVLGGSFSEGVDLPGRRLIGVGIVGVGLPGLSVHRNLLKEYYDTTRESGYDYAYTYPGMNRVLQAAGRVIRREEDRGVIVLMDCRYADPLYRSMIPEHWSHIQYAGNAPELANIVDEFWNTLSQQEKNEIF